MAVEQVVDRGGGRFVCFEFHLLYFFDCFVIKTVYADQRLGVFAMIYVKGDESGMM
jgi:hypothetical protein